MDQLPLDGKRVLLRVDFNVSIGDNGKVDSNEDYRIESALSTIEELMQRRCKILLLTHRGRPDEGESGAAIDLEPIRHRLEDLLKEPVRQLKALYGDEVTAVLDGVSPGSVLLLPNVRRDERESAGNQKFAQQLASSADAYVNEAFSVAHRAHTSVALVPQELPACAGRHTVREVAELTKLRAHPEQPYIAIVSGAKITTKVGLLHDLLTRVSGLCVGGQLANVFLVALGKLSSEGYHTDDIAAARYILEEKKEKLILPVDVVIGESDGQGATVVSVDAIPADVRNIWDIGPGSTEIFLQHCRAARTVMWNGPVGKFEVDAYATGTMTLARALGDLRSYRVVGGGDTVNALEQLHVDDKYDHVSVGGGAMIAFLEGKRMPGLAPLFT